MAAWRFRFALQGRPRSRFLLPGVPAFLASRGASCCENQEHLPRPGRDPQTGRFKNPWLDKQGKDPCEKGLLDVFGLLRDSLIKRPGVVELRRKLGGLTMDLQKPVPVDWQRVRELRRDPSAPAAVVWLGHASVLCICAGKLVLFDPVFSERCSPFSFVGPKRYGQCPLNEDLSDWPQDLSVDVVAVSHAHYDHLDEGSVCALRAKFPDARFIAPLGLGKWFENHGIKLDAEMNWWEEVPEILGPHHSLVCLPAQHWANRWPWDRNETLWCGYGIVERGESLADAKGRMHFFFAGDTGYCSVFKLIGSKYAVDMAALPIGAYHPRWFMAASHCDPSEAVKMAGELGAKSALAIHWGTFPLTTETAEQQLADLSEARDRSGDARLRALLPGSLLTQTWRTEQDLVDMLGEDVTENTQAAS